MIINFTAKNNEDAEKILKLEKLKVKRYKRVKVNVPICDHVRFSHKLIRK